jgi:hypothetical protein
MALVTYVLGDCPGCGRAESFGNVDVFGGKELYRGCKACSYNVRIPLPKLQKKIVYLDQFFFSHAFRGQEPEFLEAAARIERASSLQLLVAPYSSIHEDETHQWTGRDELFRFLKSVSRGHKFRYAEEVHRIQLIKGFEAWRAGQPADYQREEADALQVDVHGWDSYFRIEVGRYVGDIDLIRSLKTESLEGLLDCFDGWRQLQTTFDNDLNAEYEVAARGYIDFYLGYIMRLAGGDNAALLNAPSASMVVESMIRRLLRDNTPPDDCLRICAQFLMQSQHFKEVPHEKIAARIHASMKAMVKGGAFTNLDRARKKFKGYFYDVAHISTYAPYCDAFVMDQAMADLVRQPTVDLEGRYGTKVFTRKNLDIFFTWLESLEQDITPSHRDGLATAYPKRQV